MMACPRGGLKRVCLICTLACASALPDCPTPHKLEELITHSSVDGLAQLLRSCSRLADSQRQLISAARSVLAAADAMGGDAPVPHSAGPDVGHSSVPDEPPPVPPRRAMAATVASSRKARSKEKLPTWHNSKEEQALAQHAQVELIRARMRSGKPRDVIGTDQRHERLAWTVPCDDRLYVLGPPQVTGCTPSDRRGEPEGSSLQGCGRVVRDGFLTRAEQEALIGVVERAMRGLFHQGAQTSFAPDAASAAKQMGATGVALYQDAMRRVLAAVTADFGLPALYSAGSLFTRIWADDVIPDDGMNVDPGHRYYNAHVDKANRASYDYSALLYLNTHCVGAGCDYANTAQPNFAGGLFAWLGEERDQAVEPVGGRLLTFTGGLENPHQLTKVERGTRYVIGMWFTCHEELKYVDDDAAPRAKDDPPPVPPRRHKPAAADDGAPPVPPRRAKRGDIPKGGRTLPELSAPLQEALLNFGRVAPAGATPTVGKAGATGSPQMPAPQNGDYSFGLNDDLSLDEAMEAYGEALRRYDAVHGPPRESAEDEAALAVHDVASDGSNEVDAAWARAFDGSDGSGGDYSLQAVDRQGQRGGLHGEADPENLRDGPEIDSASAMGHRGEEAGYPQDTDSSPPRKDCGFPGITEDECVVGRGCVWDDSELDVPWCYT